MKPSVICVVLFLGFPVEKARNDNQPNMVATPIDWAKAKDWSLYYLKSKKAFSYSPDTLINFKKVALDQDSMRAFLKTASPIPLAKTPLWMGYYVTSCR